MEVPDIPLSPPWSGPQTAEAAPETNEGNEANEVNEEVAAAAAEEVPSGLGPGLGACRRF